MELRDDGENRGSSEGRQAKVSEKMGNGGERRQAWGGRDKVGWLGRVTEEDQKKPMVWACARQYRVTLVLKENPQPCLDPPHSRMARWPKTPCYWKSLLAQRACAG